jgi:hypothetical protein
MSAPSLAAVPPYCGLLVRGCIPRVEYRAIAQADLLDGLSTLAGKENLLKLHDPHRRGA